MSSSRLVRGAKTRMFACVCLVSVLGALLYVFHGTQTRLAEVQKDSSNCNQQLESLSAQLQVIFEYKLRLEKSLKKEKVDHQHTKEECKSKEKEERDARDKEKTEATNKYDALVQQCKMQKSHCEDDRENNEKILAKMKEEKTLLENSLQSIKEKMKDKEMALEQFKNKYAELEQELKKQRELNEDLASKNIPNVDKLNRLHKQTVLLNTQLTNVKNSLDECNLKLGKEQHREVSNNNAENGGELLKQDNTNALEPPRVGNLATSNSSTTPGINPDAVSNQELSSAKPSVADKRDDLVMPPPKRSTQQSSVHLQENAGPLVQPAPAGQNTGGGGGESMNMNMLNAIQSIDQIPLPPKPQSIIDPIKKPVVHRSQHQHHDNDNDNDNNIQLGPLNPVAEVEEAKVNNSPWGGGGGAGEGGQQHDEEDNDQQLQIQQHHQQHQLHQNNMDHNNAIEDLEDPDPHNFVRQRENPDIPRQGKVHAADYHGGDYDKEPPEEEEDDEGEQMDYVQAANNNEQARKEEQSKQAALQRLRHVDDSNGGGIMVNPK